MSTPLDQAQIDRFFLARLKWDGESPLPDTLLDIARQVVLPALKKAGGKVYGDNISAEEKTDHGDAFYQRLCHFLYRNTTGGIDGENYRLVISAICRSLLDKGKRFVSYDLSKPSLMRTNEAAQFFARGAVYQIRKLLEGIPDSAKSESFPDPENEQEKSELSYPIKVHWLGIEDLINRDDLQHKFAAILNTEQQIESHGPTNGNKMLVLELLLDGIAGYTMQETVDAFKCVAHMIGSATFDDIVAAITRDSTWSDANHIRSFSVEKKDRWNRVDWQTRSNRETPPTCRPCHPYQIWHHISAGFRLPTWFARKLGEPAVSIWFPPPALTHAAFTRYRLNGLKRLHQELMVRF